MNIIVTGASTGIGFETVKLYSLESGNKIIALARRKELLMQLVTESGKDNVIPVSLDIAGFDYTTLLKVLQENEMHHIDILIHNAGCLINKPFEELSANEWEEIYRVNVIGVAMLTRSLLPLMGGSKPTHIVMISSIGGISGSLKFSGLSAYSSSKAALCVLAEMLAEEFKNKNIFVNCLALGSVQTEMLGKAFPGYTANLSASAISDYIFEFGRSGWKYFNGKILPVSTANP